MKKLRDDIDYWLFDYVDPDDRVGVTAMIFRIAWKHSKASFVKGLLLGSVATLLFILWVR